LEGDIMYRVPQTNYEDIVPLSPGFVAYEVYQTSNRNLHDNSAHRAVSRRWLSFMFYNIRFPLWFSTHWVIFI